MEEKLDCFLMLPLRETALRRIAVFLANKRELVAAIQQFPLETFISYENKWIERLWREIEHTISKILLPESIKKEMIPVLKAVASEILKWKFIHYEYLGEINDYIVQNLCWTTAAAIDYPKTSGRLVRSNATDITQRFMLACLYCMDDCIPSLWNKLPRWKKRRICRGADPPQVDTPCLQLFLPYIFEKRVGWVWPELRNIRSDCFQYEEVLCNEAAAKYYLNKLSEEEREVALSAEGVDTLYFNSGRKSQRPDVLSYFLSLMTCEQRFRFLKNRPCEVLACFLNWPWQDLYLDIADIVWTFLHQSLYESLLQEIKEHIETSGYYLPDFIQKFFSRSPVKFRKYFVEQECRDAFFFKNFFIQADFESMRVIFGNMDAVDKEKLLFSRKFFKLLNEYRLKNQWRIVEECIQQAMLSEEDNARLKEAFAEFATEPDNDSSDTDVSETDDSESEDEYIYIGQIGFFVQMH